MAAQTAARLYTRGESFDAIAARVDITERAAIDAVMAMCDLDHCPRCYQLKRRAAAVCEDCARELAEASQ